MPKPSRNDIYEAIIRKKVNRILEEEEAVFSESHGQDTDEALLHYLQDRARELGYSPRYKEIIGWKLLERRFGCWNAVLRKADLKPAPRYPVTKLPRIMEIMENQKRIYRENQAKKKQKNLHRMEINERRTVQEIQEVSI